MSIVSSAYPTPAVIAALICVSAADNALAQFEIPSAACPGAVQLVDGTPADPDRVLDLYIPSGGSATCNSLPPAYPFPENDVEAAARIRDIRGAGDNITFINNIRGIVGETPEFEANFDGSGNTVINNGDLQLFINGDSNSVTNAEGFLSGNAIGDDFELINEPSGVVLGGMTIEGSGADVRNAGAIADGFPSPSVRGRGVLIIGADATVDNQGNGVIAVNGDEGTAVFLEGNRSRIDNAGIVSAEGAETVGAGIVGNGTAAQRVTIANTGSITTEGAESTATFIEGDFGLIDNDNEIVVNGNEATGAFIEGNNARIENSGTIEVNGNLATGAVIAGNDGVIANEGTVTINGNTAVGLGGLGNNIDVANRNTIVTTGENAIGMAVLGTKAGALNAAGAEIRTANDGAHGMLVGVEDLDAVLGGLLPSGIPNEIQSAGLVGNEGDIKTGGAGAHGISVHMSEGTIGTFDGSTIETTGGGSHGIAATGSGENVLRIRSVGSISTIGANSDGINIDRSFSVVTNEGTIRTSGVGSAGVEANGNVVLVDNEGTIETTGLAGSGIVANITNTAVFNSGSIKTSGISAHGIQTSSGAENLDLSLGGAINTTGLTADGANIAGNDIRLRVSGDIKATAADAAGVRFIGGAGTTASLEVLEGASIEGGGGAIVAGAGSETVRIAGSIKGNVNLGDGDDVFTITDTSAFEESLWNGGDGTDTLGVEVADGIQFSPLLSAFNFENFLKTGAGEMLRDENLIFDEITIEQGILKMTDGAEISAESLVVVPTESDPFKSQLILEGDASAEFTDALLKQGVLDVVDGSLTTESLVLQLGGRLDVADGSTFTTDTLRFVGSDETLAEAGTLNITDIEIAASDDATPIRSNVTLATDMSVEVLDISDSTVTVAHDLDVTFDFAVDNSSLNVDAGTVNTVDAAFTNSDLQVDSGAELDVATNLDFDGGDIDVFGKLEARTADIDNAAVYVEFGGTYNAGDVTMDGSDLAVEGDLNAGAATITNTEVSIGFDGDLDASSLTINGGDWEVEGDVDVTTASIANSEVLIGEDGSWVTGRTTVGEGASMEVDGAVRGDFLVVSGGDFCANGFVGFVNAVAEDGSRFDPGCSIADMVLGGDFEFGGMMEFEFETEELFDTVTVMGDLIFTGGLFEFSFLDDFVPRLGMTYDVLNVGGSILGADLLSFSTIGLDGFNLDFSFDDRGLSFEIIGGAASVPEPGTFYLLLTGIASIFALRRRQRMS